VDEPLWIVHQPIDEANTGSTVSVDAMIKHISGVNNASVFWREEGDTNYNEEPMSFVSGDDWSADLSIPASPTNIEYYIEAGANSGKVLTRPIVAPEGYWTINVGTLSTEDWAINNISEPYPNPTTNQVSFYLNQIEGPIQLSIYSILGQQLYKTSIEHGDGVVTLDLQDNWNGTLFVVFEGSFGRINKKVIKY
jgi:hypothetical protein